MKLQEFHAKKLLLAQGLPVPAYSVAETAAEARAAAESYLAGGSGKVVIKAQVLVGGRGKAGGVKLASHTGRSRTGGPRHPRHGHQGHDRPARVGGSGGRHRQGVLPRRRAGSQLAPGDAHGLG